MGRRKRSFNFKEHSARCPAGPRSVIPKDALRSGMVLAPSDLDPVPRPP